MNRGAPGSPPPAGGRPWRVFTWLLCVAWLLAAGCSGKCKRICAKLVSCQAIEQPACMAECGPWFRTSPRAAHETWRRVEPLLDQPCRRFFRAALR